MTAEADGISSNMATNIKSDPEITLMRQAGRIVALTLEALSKAIKPGIVTAELDAVAEQEIRSRKGTPSFKGYHGFPASICVTVNDEVVHGIPGKRVLKEGDIVSLDVGAICEGFQRDAALTVPVGKVGAQARALRAPAARGVAARARGAWRIRRRPRAPR